MTGAQASSLALLNRGNDERASGTLALQSNHPLPQVVLTTVFRVCLCHSRSASIFWRNQIMFSKRAGLWLGLIATLGLLSLGSSCNNKGGGDEGAGTEGGGAAYASKGDEGTISGTIAF